MRRVPRSHLLDRAQHFVGIEHEFTVLRHGEPIDFAKLLPHLPIEGINADPADRNARRCRWGGVVTADGIEAEVATPPIPLAPGAVDEAAALAALGRGEVERTLPPDHHLGGWSTHLNVSAPTRGDARRARQFCSTFAPGLVLLLERADSPGLLVRPRPGRLELCGEFVDGPRLAAALTFAAGATRALSDRKHRTDHLVVDVEVAPSRQRFGHFLSRTAFGPDLHTEGRDAVLLSGGGHRRAQVQLELGWAVARAALDGVVDQDELDRVDELVSSDARLPVANEEVP